MPTPAPTLSPTERRILAAAAGGSPGEMMLDWVAFQRLLAFGYLEASGAGRVQVTAKGRRALSGLTGP